MVDSFKLTRLDSKYCDYLRVFDNKVAYNKNKKEQRPFVGVLFSINDMEYFAPLSSPKPKHIKMHNSLDFIKLDGGKLGAINFNNMIPVSKNSYKIINLQEKTNSLKEKQYQKLLIEQLQWLNANSIQVKGRAHNLYKKFINNKLPDSVRDRCCNYLVLEEKCKLYNRDKIIA